MRTMTLASLVAVLVVAAAAWLQPAAATSPGNIVLTETTIIGEVEDMLWVGSSKQVVLVLTDMGRLYRSSNEGMTWVDQTEVLSAAVKGRANGPPTGVVTAMIPHASRSEYILFQGQGRVSWSTQDGGAKYQVIESELTFHEMKMHPLDPKKVLASTMSDKCSDSGAEGYCYKNLFYSSNFGQSWTFQRHYVVQFDWAHKLGAHVPHTVARDAIFFTEFNSKYYDQKFGYWDRDIDFFVTNNFFKTSKMLVRRGNRFLFTSKYIFIAQVHEHYDNQVNLVITRDGGASFHNADLPFQMMQHSYTVVDSSEDTVFLHVNHGGARSEWGNIYVSNGYGLNYTLSLPHNSRALTGKCDFDKMEGLEGHYLANYVDNVKYAEDFDANFNDMGMGMSAAAADVLADNVQHKAIKTVITFDKGGVWNFIRPPRVDANGQPVTCVNQGCSLHLHGVTSSFGPFYTAANSVGLAMATGNIGTELSSHPDEVNTYFSRDGGLNWYEVAKGSHIYEFGDHGALIVMAKDLVATDTLYYSWSEGSQWQMLRFVNTPMEVVNIIVEPQATSQRFVVYGAREVNEQLVGVVVYVDFSSLHERECKGVKDAGSPDSDYEHFTPSDGRAGDECFLGHKVSYTRRKRDHECFNGIHHERGVKIHDCECVGQDWECDVGYSRRVDGGACMRTEGVNITAFLPTYCPVSGHYLVTDGYRKVAGDTCKGGLQHHATKVKCSHWGHLSGFGFFVLLLVVGIVCAMGCMTYTQGTQGPGGHSAIGEMFDLVLTYVPFLRKFLILLHRVWEKASDKASALAARFLPAGVRRMPRLLLSKLGVVAGTAKSAVGGAFARGSGGGGYGSGLGGRVNNATYAQIGQATADSALDYAENLSAADFDDDDSDSDADDDGDVESAELFDSSRGISEALNAGGLGGAAAAAAAGSDSKKAE